MGNSNSSEEAVKKLVQEEIKKRREENKKIDEERMRQEILENSIREKLWKELELKNRQQEMLRRQEDLRRIKAQQEAQKKVEQELQKREEELRRIKAQQEELRRIVDQEAQKKRQQDVQKQQDAQKRQEELQRIKAQQEEQKKRQQDIQKRQENLQRIAAQEEELRKIEDQKEAEKKRQQDVQKRQEELQRKAQQRAQKKRQQDVQKRQEELRRIETGQWVQELDDKIEIDRIVQERVRLELEREKLKLQEVFNWQQREQQRKETLEKQKKFVDSLRQYKIIKNLSLINDLRQSFGWHVLKDYPITSYTEKELSKTSKKYRTVEQMFKTLNMSCFNVSKIIEINNPFLVLHYRLKKAKLTKKKGKEILESDLFHGTKCEYLDGICSLNFDQSKVKKHGFGWGISFTTRSICATHHHKDNRRQYEKVMILAKVLVDETAELGNVETIIPKEPCYTTTNKDKSVIVKYDDASFYPVYIVHYEGIHHFLNKQNGSREELTPNENEGDWVDWTVYQFD